MNPNMKHFLKYIYSVLAIILVVSCATSRKAADQQKDNVLSDWQSRDAVVSRAAIKIKNGREREISLSGNLKMLRNDVIILNATYIFGIQIGFVELTPEKVLIVSRATKQYTEISYAELSAKLGKIISFEDFQRLFWGENADIQFKGVKWKHDEFVLMPDGRKVPSELSMNLTSANKSIALQIRLINLRYDNSWNSRMHVDFSTYTKLTLDQFYTLLSSMVNK